MTPPTQWCCEPSATYLPEGPGARLAVKGITKVSAGSSGSSGRETLSDYGMLSTVLFTLDMQISITEVHKVLQQHSTRDQHSKKINNFWMFN